VAIIATPFHTMDAIYSGLHVWTCYSNYEYNEWGHKHKALWLKSV